MKSSCVASEPVVASTSKAKQPVNISTDSEQYTQSKAKTAEQHGSHNSMEMPQPERVFNRPMYSEYS